MRSVLAVIVGYVLWTLLWLLGNAGLAVPFSDSTERFEAGEPITDVTYLVLALALSVVCSSLAGLVTALIAREKGRVATLIMALLLLATGIAVQASAWDLMPVWYHLVFLALIVPVCTRGARRTA